MKDKDKALLQDWQRSLRALSSVVELFAAGDLVQPADADILDRVESAEVARRQAYHNSLRLAAADPGVSAQLPSAPDGSQHPASARQEVQSVPRAKAGSPSVEPAESSASKSVRTGLVRRTPVKPGTPQRPDSIAAPRLPLATDLPSGIESVGDPRVVLPYVSQIMLAVPDPQLQQRWWTVQGEVLGKQPQAKKSAATFRRELLVAGTGTAVGTPFGTELNKLLPYVDHLVKLLTARGR